MPDDLVLRIAVSAPLHSIFDYLPPRGVDGAGLKPGVRLRVPFGRGERMGLLLEQVADSRLERGRLKRVLEVIDREPLLGSEDLYLLKWAASYYQHPLGEVMNAALPTRLRKGRPVAGPERPGWRLTPLGLEQLPGHLARAPRQADILEALREASGGLSQEAIYACCGECRAVLRTLEKKGWLQRCEMDAAALPSMASPREGGHSLNGGQAAAVAAVLGAEEVFGVFLLDGVTGSGKTEVYLALVERMITRGGQILILVPEIALTPQLMRRFQRRIHAPLALLHSGLSEGERERAWMDAASGRAAVVLGTRSAVFTPMPHLSLILMDEEHDLSFKQQEGFRYSARDIAVVRARQWGCPVMLGSATPSLESLRNAQGGRYQHLSLPQRAGNAVAPRMDLLDIRSVRLDGGVSPTLFRMMGEELQAGNQVLLFLNRRGYAPLLACFDCGWLAQCRRCDARMTLHLGSRILWCHHCGSQRPLDRSCPDCKSGDLHPMGQGTERLEEVLQGRFPDVGIVRFDRDSTRRKGSLDTLLGEIREGKYSLLLGTQMLAKGHHFPDVTLVGILDVDQGLFGADYRASERMAQLVVQVAGRAGRAEKPGRVIIQTRHPDHPLLHTLVRRGYGAFAAEALAERREAMLPPFGFQALLRAESPSMEVARGFLEQAVAESQTVASGGVEFWGPVSAPMERRAGRYRAQLLLQSGDRSVLQQLLADWLPRVRGLKSAGRVRWSIDVDPQEMF